MSLEIKNIANANLKAAAEMADTQGDMNLKLDSKEITVFVTEAKRMNCSTADIMAYAEQVGVGENDKKAKEKLNALAEIEKLEKEIASAEKELETRKQAADEMDPGWFNYGAAGATVGGVAGLSVGVRAGAKVAIKNLDKFDGATHRSVFDLNKLLINKSIDRSSLKGKILEKLVDYSNKSSQHAKRLRGRLGFIPLLIGTVAGVLAGVFAGKAAGKAIEPQERAEKREQYEIYNSKAVESFEEKINGLKEQLSQKTEAFYAN